MRARYQQSILGIYWIGFAIAHAVLLRRLPHGDAIIVDVLVGTFIGDTAAYIGGRMFGRRPLAPEISPNKTVEGLLIGMVAAVAGVWFAGLYQDWLSGTDALILGHRLSEWCGHAPMAILAVFLAGLYQTWLTQGDALLLGVAVAVLGPLGDLFESLIKRDAGVKDAGSLFGPHGGALDRLDAVLFTIPVSYYVWVALM